MIARPFQLLWTDVAKTSEKSIHGKFKCSPMSKGKEYQETVMRGQRCCRLLTLGECVKEDTKQCSQEKRIQNLDRRNKSPCKGIYED